MSPDTKDAVIAGAVAFLGIAVFVILTPIIGYYAEQWWSYWLQP